MVHDCVIVGGGSGRWDWEGAPAMRTRHRGIAPVGASFEITFDGEALDAYPGETLAAALTAAGKLGLRRARRGRRGLFCGMGVCGECVVSLEGRDSARACMTLAEPGMRVATHDHRPAVPEGAAWDPPAGEAPAEEIDVLVVGAGPAGLSAARAAALAGASVTLIDERPALGGQYYKQLATSHAFSDGRPTDRQFREGHALIAEVAALGVRLLSGVLVWAAAPGELAALVAGRAQVFRPAQLILATGAYECGVPVPGWTLPGFMTTGAAQTLLRAYRVAPGRRVLVAGNGPLNAQVACELLEAGVEVAAWVEAAPAPGWRHLPAALGALWHAPDLIRDGRRYLARLRRARVPRLWGHLLVAAGGDEAVERATVAPLGRDGAPIMARARSFAVDAVCAGYGFLPANELSRLLKCRHRYDPPSASLVAERDADGATTVPGVFVAGDCARMEGSRAAGEQGLLAGLAAARALGKAIPADLAAEKAHGRRRLASHRRFQRALWSPVRRTAAGARAGQRRHARLPLRRGDPGCGQAGPRGRNHRSRQPQAAHPRRHGVLPGALLRPAAGDPGGRGHWRGGRRFLLLRLPTPDQARSRGRHRAAKTGNAPTHEPRCAPGLRRRRQDR